jgi:hypothetical protein
MMISFKKYQRMMELAGRPDYYKKWDQATAEHMKPFQFTFRERMEDLRDVKESL